MPSATTRTTKMKIAVPKTAPMILFHSKESICGQAPQRRCLSARETIEKTGSPRRNTGGHYPPPPFRHCGEASHKSQLLEQVGARLKQLRCVPARRSARSRAKG